METLIESKNSVDSKESFSKFLTVLLDDLRTNKNSWENDNLESYLEAMKAWTDVMEHTYTNRGMEMPKQVSWNVFAKILYAAKIYE